MKLIKEASKHDKSFKEFLPFAEEINDYYVESRYPLGYEAEFEREEIKNAIEKAEQLISFIKGKF